jgi:putative sigma-54 modulation protein
LLTSPCPSPLPLQVVRSKVLHLDAALTVDEAVEALEAIGHDFYIFKNKATGGVQVLYRRKSSGYGLLTPQI